jgi:hypothetical protein
MARPHEQLQLGLIKRSTCPHGVSESELCFRLVAQLYLKWAVLIYAQASVALPPQEPVAKRHKLINSGHCDRVVCPKGGIYSALVGMVLSSAAGSCAQPPSGILS